MNDYIYWTGASGMIWKVPVDCAVPSYGYVNDDFGTVMERMRKEEQELAAYDELDQLEEGAENAG